MVASSRSGQCGSDHHKGFGRVAKACKSGVSASSGSDSEHEVWVTSQNAALCQRHKKTQRFSTPNRCFLCKVGSHQCEYPFTSSVLAHAFRPNTLSFEQKDDTSNIIGDVHFNDDMPWNPELLLATTIHEVGHSLGLPHVLDDPNSVMYPVLVEGQRFTPRDIQTIQTMYGMFENNACTKRFRIWQLAKFAGPALTRQITPSRYPPKSTSSEGRSREVETTREDEEDVDE
ncbi:Matrixin [Oesophagostomum dentatum]|uniref:Matrixin n=1 Tax=Oesophagostomum dentatum TaxID=61180 RepID=A0A0B1SVY7_OESDE|nr:Matrixin [Oesophagostomum dentatum]